MQTETPSRPALSSTLLLQPPACSHHAPPTRRTSPASPRGRARPAGLSPPHPAPAVCARSRQCGLYRGAAIHVSWPVCVCVCVCSGSTYVQQREVVLREVLGIHSLHRGLRKQCFEEPFSLLRHDRCCILLLQKHPDLGLDCGQQLRSRAVGRQRMLLLKQDLRRRYRLAEDGGVVVLLEGLDGTALREGEEMHVVPVEPGAVFWDVSRGG